MSLMKKLFDLIVVSIITFFVLTVVAVFYFLFIKECPYYPIDNISNAVQGEYEIVGLTQACMMTRPHGEYYLKHKNDTSDGFKRRNLIVESHAGSGVKVKWVSDGVIQVTSYREGSIRKISKTVKGNDVRLVKNYSWQDED